MADNRTGAVPESFSLEELVAELREIAEISEIAERPPNTYRTEEIIEALGCGSEQARRIIREWVEQGLCKPTKAPHENMWGVVQRVPMIQFVAVQDRATQEKLL